MSILKLELTNKHIKLLKYLKCNLIDGNIILSIDADDGVPILLTDDNKYEYIDLTLNGMPEDFDPFNMEEMVEYTKEQKDEWDKLYNELPLALDVIMFNGNFELGSYATQYHDRNWRAVKSK